MRIALTGNPNSGKTTMFNHLTGSNEKVGNWAGVTVDKKEKTIKKSLTGNKEPLVAVDLPGAYSMSPFTGEENITSSYVKKENPDVIINIVDATNLSRSLFFTTQLLELGIPMVVALNKSDINQKKQTKIEPKKLAKMLGCPVVETISTSSNGLKSVINKALSVVGKPQSAPYRQENIDLTDRAAVEAADRARFEFVNTIVEAVETRKVLTKDKNFDDKIDAILTNKWIGIPIFALVMYLVFQISQVWLGAPIADFLVSWLEIFQGWADSLLVNANPLLSALLVDGILGGVIAVIGFLPLVMVLYFLIAVLEDCGYMSRVAALLDPIFKKVGLSGKSAIPFVIAIGCAVPGIMASRTIRNERERRASVMLAPFMPCGAKIPLIALFAGAFFQNAGWVSTLMYLSGIILIFVGALLINLVTGYKAKKSFFIMELPQYKFPSLWGAFQSMCSRGWAYIVKAATIILLCNTAVQIMQSFDWGLKEASSPYTSILASIAAPFSYLLVPIVGVLSWQLAAAAISGFIAKENVVGTLAVCFGATRFINVESLEMVGNASDTAKAITGFDAGGQLVPLTAIAALAYLMFNLYSPPCFAAIGAMNAEMKSAKWLWGGIGLQLGIGYTVAYLVYTVGTLLTTPSAFSPSAALGGGVAVLAFVCILVGCSLRANRSVKREVALSKQ